MKIIGFNTIYIQAKKWQQKSTIGRPEIQKFYGALGGQRAHKGVFITTGNFTAEARTYAHQSDKKIILIDGKELTQLMMEYHIGCKVKSTFTVKELDANYFEN